jgi:LmbE family N-acetylglucosaminyl deacetylase
MNKPRWIYISPHLDDAVLSCGGIIREQTWKGTPVEIWTLICGYPSTSELSSFAQLMHFQWGTGSAEETITLRRAEDKRAAGLIGASTHHFNTPDCIYRRSAKGEPLYPLDIFVPPHPLESSLSESIAHELENALQPDDILVCPLTIGGHVDHVLTRGAVEHLRNQVWYYADVPYLLNHGNELAPATEGMRSKLHGVSEEGLTAWLDGIAAYSSQIKVLFESEEKMRSSIQDYWREKQGVILWKVREPSAT